MPSNAAAAAAIRRQVASPAAPRRTPRAPGGDLDAAVDQFVQSNQWAQGPRERRALKSAASRIIKSGVR